MLRSTQKARGVCPNDQLDPLQYQPKVPLLSLHALVKSPCGHAIHPYDSHMLYASTHSTRGETPHTTSRQQPVARGKKQPSTLRECACPSSQGDVNGACTCQKSQRIRNTRSRSRRLRTVRDYRGTKVKKKSAEPPNEAVHTSASHTSALGDRAPSTMRYISDGHARCERW